MAKPLPISEKSAKPEKTKVGAMETTELRNYSFPTIGDGGVVIQASSQEEANAAAAKLKADMEEQKEGKKEKDKE